MVKKRRKRVKIWANYGLIPINFVDFVSVFEVKKVRKKYRKGVRTR